MSTKRIFLSPPHMGTEELKFVQEAFSSNYIAPLGEMIDNFEKEFSEYTKIKYSTAVSSGTAAMHLVLRCLGVGPGDEVFASTFTFIGSISPITFLGARPVFIDADEKSWNMDPILLEKELKRCFLLGKLPKAVVPTDLYGQCADMSQIIAICDMYNVPVVCDSAESLGAYWLSDKHSSKVIKRHAGKGAFAAIFSFNGNKIITTSGGGMVASDNKELIQQIQFLATQAKEPVPYYEHKTIGYNYRMSNILAAIGRGQLRVLNKRIEKKQLMFSYYKKHLTNLKGITFMPEPQYSIGTRWLTCIRVDPILFGTSRETIRLALENNNIEARPVWKPMHTQPVFLRKKFEQTNSARAKGTYKTRTLQGKVSEKIYNEGLCLPSGTAMSFSDLDKIIATIRQCRYKT